MALSAVERRLVDTSAAIMGDAVDDPAFLHVIMAQVGLPYRDPKNDFYERSTGRASIALTAGRLRDPHSRQWVKPGLPYGARPRLLMLHLCTYAVQHQSPVVPIKDSMTAFMRDMNITATGGQLGSIARFKDQMNRLSAAQMQFSMDYGRNRAVQFNPAPMIRKADLWFPQDARQLTLWASEVRLSNEFFDELKKNALPVDPRAFHMLQHSARALDLYTWLAHRLRRVKERGGAFISWQALQQQFGSDTTQLQNFRRQCTVALNQALYAYKDAKVFYVPGGIRLFKSSPPIPEKTSVRGSRVGPKVIEGKAEELP
ncbi:MAG: hypothetical protein EOP50_00920 [Sphingobacteriales bacterium]|nr:MAG: hypothetical protein EOP50_00920 [Sphingobacteriales bacterium]